MTAMRSGFLSVLSLSLTLAAGCDAGAAANENSRSNIYPVVLKTLNEEREPLPNVELAASGSSLGQTGRDGVLQTQLRGAEGAQVTFEARCPVGFHAQGDAATLRLRTLAGAAPPEVELVCGNDKRIAALVVSAPGFSDLPVLVHNREVARTDSDGIAHVLLEGTPATPLRVVLNTSSRPRVVPVSPHKDLQIAARDDIVVFAPELSEIVVAPPKKKHVKKEAPPPKLIRPEKLR
jgi:hypothetical protein